jgi:putative transposase
LDINRRTFRRNPGVDKDAALRARMREIAETRRRFGAPRLHILLRREGLVINHKRTERVYREERLSLRLRKRNKRPSHSRVPQVGPLWRDEQWSMDFLSDALMDGRRIRILTIVDLWDRNSPALEVDVSLPGQRVVRTLERLRLQGCLPQGLRLDNGPEFTGKELDAWAHTHNVRLDFIRPGKPIDNGHIESFNGKMRDECLNQNVFLSLADARDSLERWRTDYNQSRPHSSLDWMSPEEYYEHHQPFNPAGTTNLNLGYPMG